MRVGQVRRRDANEGDIVRDLRRLGFDVTQVSGEGAPDLLIRVRGRTDALRLGLSVGCEVKTNQGKQTTAQKESDWPIVRDLTDVLELLRGAAF